MRKVVIAVSATLIATSASAATPKKKDPPPSPPAPVHSWTGWYVGGNIGGSWGDAHTDLAGSGAFTGLFGGLQPPAAFSNSQTQRLKGLIGGGQIGYNYQISPQWVLGWEADIQGSGERGNGSSSDPFSTTLCFGLPCSAPFDNTPLNGTAMTSDQAKIEWFGTVRGRVGMLINDGLLLYGTGGLAYGRVGVSGNVNISAATAPAVGITFGPSADGFGQSRTNIGFAAGGGLEGRLSAWLPLNWMWKLEYLYVDLGSLDASAAFAVASNASPTFSP
jgi:outer membrane immunogenic protein